MRLNNRVTDSRTSRAYAAARSLVVSFSIPGVVVATFFFWQSLMPSLLPRDWLFQGILSGIWTLIGYFIGWLLGRIGHLVGIRPTWSDDTAALIRLALFAAAVVFSLVMFGISADRQRFNYQALDLPEPQRRLYGLVVLITAAIVGLALLVGRVVSAARRLVSRGGRTFLPRWVAATLSFAVVALLLAVLVSDVIYARAIGFVENTFSVADTRIEDDEAAKPDDVTLDWGNLGSEGRDFLTRGPDAADITAVTGKPAIDPVRVFVGRESADTLDERVDLVFEELDRTDAFSRGTILFNVTTGTGWVNERNVAPVEYMLDGDTATLALQYSHLPSALSMFTEQGVATDAARKVIAGLEERIAALPEAERPRLFLVGESLGAFAGQSSFADVDDLLARVDKALWVGTPGFTTMRADLEDERVDGSRQMLPTIRDGEQVVFAQTAQTLGGTSPQVVYLQNADDPVVWWDADLAFSKPDWMREELDPRINPKMSWEPIRTFLQVGVDTFVGTSFHEGTGHLYGTLPVAAWQALIQPGWDSGQLGALYAELREQRATPGT